MKAETKIEKFKKYWRQEYSYVSMRLTDEQIQAFIEHARFNINLAVDYAIDWSVGTGIAEVQE